MGGFFQELAKTLAERWLSLLALPGAFFIAAIGIARTLGQSQSWNYPLLTRRADEAVTAIADQPAGTQVLLAVSLLVTAVGAGFAVQALAGVTRRIWLGQWPSQLASAWSSRRRARWHRLVETRRSLERADPERRTRQQQDRIDAAADRANRLALAEPGRPTWMGDRIYAVESIARHRYGLDLTFGWPRLWLVLPDTTRAELNGAHSAFAAAVATGTWALPYLVLGVLWWPAVLIAAAVGLTGWARARAAVTDLTALAEAAIDLHGRALAAALGVANPEQDGPLTIDEGEKATDRMRKGR